jgi:hypothetical protein
MYVPDFLADPDGFNVLRASHLAMLRKHDFDGLETSLATLQKNGSQFADGVPKLDAAMHGLSDASQRITGGWLAQLKNTLTNRTEDAAWEAALEDIDAWRDHRRGSVPGATAMARACIGHGFQLRGDDWADSVPEKDWPTIMTRFRRAYDALRAVESRGLAFPPWAGAMFVAIKLTEKEVGEWYALFEKAAAVHPQHWSLYTYGVDFHLERWSGSDAQLADYVVRCVQRTQAQCGNAVAARIFTALAGTYGETALRDLRTLPWGTIKQGFADWYRQYSHASVLSYALMASRIMEDKVSARMLLRSIGQNPHACVWDSHLASTFGGWRGINNWVKTV